MNANAPSFKAMIKDGTAKRADAIKFRIEDIHEEPGFNLREEGEDLEASIDALAAHIAEGGIVPPLEVRPRIGGGVFLVDGHRRRRAYLKIADSLRDANGELFVNVVPFNGNDADRVARVITSAEGRQLSQLEVAKGYKRLAAFGWSPQEIAAKVGKTRQHVDQLLLLANANSDVQQLVKEGTVSATTAITAVRKNGENAGQQLAAEVTKAKAAGKAKATNKTIKGWEVPRNLLNELHAATTAIVGSLSKEDHATLATLTLDHTENPVTIEVMAALVWEVVAIHDAIGEAKEAADKKAREAANENAQQNLDDAA